MTTGELSCLISFAWVPPSCEEGKQAKYQNENMSPPEIEPETLDFLAGHLARLAIRTYKSLYNYSRSIALRDELHTSNEKVNLFLCIK